MLLYAELRRRCREEQILVRHHCSVDHAFEAVIAAIDALTVFVDRCKSLSPGQLLDFERDDQDIREPARRNRPDVVSEPGMFLGDLRALENQLARVPGYDRIDATTSHMCGMVSAATAALVTLLTGDKHYFVSSGSYTTAGQRELEERQAAKERGEIPWRD